MGGKRNFETSELLKKNEKLDQRTITNKVRKALPRRQVNEEVGRKRAILTEDPKTINF